MIGTIFALVVQLCHRAHRIVERYIQYDMELPKSSVIKALWLHCMVLETGIVFKFYLSTMVTLLLWLYILSLASFALSFDSFWFLKFLSIWLLLKLLVFVSTMLLLLYALFCCYFALFWLPSLQLYASWYWTLTNLDYHLLDQLRLLLYFLSALATYDPGN